MGLVVAMALVFGVLGAAFAMFMIRDSLLKGSDVGDLPQFANVQATLRPLDVCGIEYMMRTVGANQDKRGRVRIYRCTNEAFPMPIYLTAPTSFSERSLHFTIERSSREKPFAIRVDKSRVAFGELVDGLAILAPDIAARYPALRAEADAREAKDQADLRRQEAERDRARQQSRESYPSR